MLARGLRRRPRARTAGRRLEQPARRCGGEPLAHDAAADGDGGARRHRRPPAHPHRIESQRRSADLHGGGAPRRHLPGRRRAPARQAARGGAAHRRGRRRSARLRLRGHGAGDRRVRRRLRPRPGAARRARRGGPRRTGVSEHRRGSLHPGTDGGRLSHSASESGRQRRRAGARDLQLGAGNPPRREGARGRARRRDAGPPRGTARGGDRSDAPRSLSSGHRGAVQHRAAQQPPDRRRLPRHRRRTHGGEGAERHRDRRGHLRPAGEVRRRHGGDAVRRRRHPAHLQGSPKLCAGERQHVHLAQRDEAPRRQSGGHGGAGARRGGALPRRPAGLRRPLLHPGSSALRDPAGDGTRRQHRHRADSRDGAGGGGHRPAQRPHRRRGHSGLLPVRVDLRLDARLHLQLHGGVRDAARPRHADRRRHRHHRIRRPQDGRGAGAEGRLLGLREAHVLAGDGIRRHHPCGVPAAGVLARRRWQVHALSAGDGVLRAHRIAALRADLRPHPRLAVRAPERPGRTLAPHAGAARGRRPAALARLHRRLRPRSGVHLPPRRPHGAGDAPGAGRVVHGLRAVRARHDLLLRHRSVLRPRGGARPGQPFGGGDLRLGERGGGPGAGDPRHQERQHADDVRRRGRRADEHRRRHRGLRLPGDARTERAAAHRPGDSRTRPAGDRVAGRHHRGSAEDGGRAAGRQARADPVLVAERRLGAAGGGGGARAHRRQRLRPARRG